MDEKVFQHQEPRPEVEGEVVRIRPSFRFRRNSRKSKYQRIIDDLVQLKPGDGLLIPLDVFKPHAVRPSLQMQKRTGRRLHVQSRPEGLVLWLDPLPEDASDPASRPSES